jgi:hypothetical protein
MAWALKMEGALLNCGCCDMTLGDCTLRTQWGGCIHSSSGETGKLSLQGRKSGSNFDRWFGQGLNLPNYFFIWKGMMAMSALRGY